MIPLRGAGYHARVRRILAPLLLGLAVASGVGAGCQDDSVYRSGDPPPSVTDGGPDDTGAGAGGASGDDGGAD